MNNKIKVNFLLPTKDFLDTEYKKLDVTLHIPEEISEQFEYSVVIPDFMFDELKDTNERFSTKYDQNNREINKNCFSERTLTNTFKKTQTAKNINVLTEYFQDITSIIINRYSHVKTKREKKIFITFGKSLTNRTGLSTHSYKGEALGISFNYFTGYKHYNEPNENIFFKKDEHEYFTSLMYVEQDRFHSGVYNDSNVYLIKTKEQQDKQFFLLGKTKEIEQTYQIIDWTKEREDFLESILQKLNKIGDDLSLYLSDIDEKKIELLMNQDIKLIGHNE